jgi:hypothetical protein
MPTIEFTIPSINFSMETIYLLITVGCVIFAIHFMWTLKPKIAACFDAIGNVEKIVDKSTSELKRTLQDSVNSFQEQIQENVDVVRNDLNRQVSSARMQIQDHAADVNKTLASSIKSVEQTINTAASTGPVSSVVAGLTDMVTSPITALLIATGSGLVARQIYVRYTKEAYGKEGLRELTQSKILMIFDALLAACIIPTLFTNGWQTATSLWKAAKVSIDAIRTICQGMSIYQSLFGSEVENQAIPAIDKNFISAVEAIEMRVEGAIADQIKQEGMYRTHFLVRHAYDRDWFPQIHTCSLRCQRAATAHKEVCVPTNCVCEDEHRKDNVGSIDYAEILYVINNFSHYRYCEMASWLSGILKTEREQGELKGATALTEVQEQYLHKILESEGRVENAKCKCYEFVENQFIIKTPTKYHDDMKSGLGSHREGLMKLWDKSEQMVETKNRKRGVGYISDEELKKDFEKLKCRPTKKPTLSEAKLLLNIQNTIDAHEEKKESKKFSAIIQKSFDLKDGFVGAAGSMFSELEKKPYLMPVALIIIFAILILMNSMRSKPEPWYKKKSELVLRAREKYKNGEDYKQEDKAINEWEQEGQGSRARRMAQRAATKKNKNNRGTRPWWIYDDEGDIPVDDDIDDSKDNDDEDDYVDKLDKNINDITITRDLIQKKYGKDEESKIPNIPAKSENAVVLKVYDDTKTATNVASTTTEEEETRKIVQDILKNMVEKVDKSVPPVVEKEQVKPPIVTGIQCNCNSRVGCPIHNKKKNICRWNYGNCLSKKCPLVHTDCKYKGTTCINTEHVHTVPTKKPKVVQANLQEARHNGERMVVTAQMIESLGWATTTLGELNCTKIWSGVYVSSHVFGSRPTDDMEITISIRDKDGISTFKSTFGKAKHIGYDSLYYPIPFKQHRFMNSSTEPKLGEKVTLIAYDTHADFLAGKPKVDVSVINDIIPVQSVDNKQYKGLHSRCLTVNSTQEGNCSAPYYNHNGYVVGFHNAKLQSSNIFIGVDKNMVARANGSLGN